MKSGTVLLGNMANGGEDYRTKRLLVKNLPRGFTRDKLEIYFQKSKNGGNGDVLSVTLRIFGNETTRDAVIEFESAETVKSILAKKHQLLGFQLEIQPFPEQVFGACDIVVNKSMAAKIKHSPSFSSILQNFTGAIMEQIDGDFHIKGQWYQIEAAVVLIDKLNKPLPSSTDLTALLPLRELPSAEAMAVRSEPPKLVPAQFQELPAGEYTFKYYLLCYPEVAKTLMKRYKATLRYNEGKIIFYPAQKGVTAQLVAALEWFKPAFMGFSRRVKTIVFDYSKFSLGNVERDESIKAAMANGKVFVGCDELNSQTSRIKFLGMNEKDVQEAIDIFRTECMPVKNTILSTFGVEGKDFKVTVIHGDFQQQKGDALLSEMNEQGDTRIPLQYLVPQKGMVAMRNLIQRGIESDKKTVFTLPVLNKKIPCQWLQHFVVGKNENGRTNFKRMLTTAIIESISRLDATKVVVPVFKDNSCNVSSSDFIGMVAGAIKTVKGSANFSDIYIVHNNYKEARSLASYLDSAKQFKLLKKDDSNGTTSPTKSSTSGDEDVCSICLDELSGAVAMRTLPCKHTFHQACIDKAFSVSMKCPLCMRFYGKPKGNHPRNGTMTSRVIRNQNLPGYKNCAIIHISYHFPSGIQGAEHPNPGSPYQGTSRYAYLPDNEEGRELLLLLRKAFEARITFTVGRSVTTGRDNVVTWNDIHHKTNINGGPQGYGYPDPTYLSRLKMELADKGITLS